MFLAKRFTFDAAHYLTKYHGKCEKLHGHTYKFEVTIEGQPNKEDMIMDFLDLKKLVQKKVLKHLDHSNLNDFFKNPTAENICTWIWQKLEPEFVRTGLPADRQGRDLSLHLHKIQLWETEDSSVTIQK